jgi:hypothetical protein
LRWRLLAALVVALFGVQLLANSRTFIAGAFGAAVAWVLLVPLGKALPASIKSAAIVLAPLPVQAGMIWVAVQGPHGTHTVSNITRSIGILTGAELWRSNPLLGIGLGQYGFHFRAIIPSWGLQSYEISKYFRRDQYDLLGGLPPSFSLFTRLGAELGVVGLLAWILPQFYVIRRAIILCPGSMTTLMVCAFASNIWIGLSLDSFRNIYYWFWLAALLAWPQQCAYSNASGQIPTAWSRQVRA